MKKWSAVKHLQWWVSSKSFLLPKKKSNNEIKCLYLRWSDTHMYIWMNSDDKLLSCLCIYHCVHIIQFVILITYHSSSGTLTNICDKKKNKMASVYLNCAKNICSRLRHIHTSRCIHSYVLMYIHINSSYCCAKLYHRWILSALNSIRKKLIGKHLSFNLFVFNIIILLAVFLIIKIFFFFNILKYFFNILMGKFFF